MKKIVIAVSLIFLSLGAAKAQQEPSSKAKTLEELGAESRERERQRTEYPEAYQAKLESEVRKYLRCSERAAGELDDAISDVSTIALGIQSFCGAELDSLATISASPKAGWVSALHPRVVATILARRAKLRNAKKKS